MHASLQLAYTNEVSAEYLSHMDDCYFKEQQPSSFIDEKRAYVKALPPIAIYRVATEGSQTRDGGWPTRDSADGIHAG